MKRVLRLCKSMLPSGQEESDDGRSWRVLLVGLVLTTVVAGEAAGQRPQLQPAALFRSVEPAAVAPVSASAPVSGMASDFDLVTVRRRLVSIDFGQFTPAVDVAGAASGGPSASGVLPLNLFDDVSFTGIVERVAPTFSGGYSLSGRLSGVEMGTMTLVVNGTVVAGTVRTPEAVYRIRPDPAGGLHVVSQIDPSRLPPLGVPISPPRAERPAPPERAPDRSPIPVRGR
ncbi:MAG: hypothetical protein OXN97_15650 [Bryobacterales bacterium]|nr:hypothetical protein [Bryobacterales bacterium]MDE0627090.1 hypothetical protein [Bryobacterales bacterium]